MNYKTLIKILIDTKRRTKGQKDKVLYRIIELINKGSNSIGGESPFCTTYIFTKTC